MLRTAKASIETDRPSGFCFSDDPGAAFLPLDTAPSIARPEATPFIVLSLRKYVAQMPAGKVVLWCYLIWYLVVAIRYFDPSPRIWLNALGISGVVGASLWLGVRPSGGGLVDRWQVFRLFLTPFCVSSFSSLIKGQGFFLIFPPSASDLGIALAACLVFVAVVALLKRLWGEDLA